MFVEFENASDLKQVSSSVNGGEIRNLNFIFANRLFVANDHKRKNPLQFWSMNSEQQNAALDHSWYVIRLFVSASSKFSFFVWSVYIWQKYRDVCTSLGSQQLLTEIVPVSHFISAAQYRQPTFFHARTAIQWKWRLYFTFATLRRSSLFLKAQLWCWHWVSR